MGAGLVLRVYEGPHAALDHAARHVLVRMAVSALDCDPQPSYWAGWQPLAVALCLKGKEDTNRTQVRRYMRELHDAGAITLTNRGNIHGPSKYRLWLDMPAPRVNGAHESCLACPVDNPPETVDNSQSTGKPRGGTTPPLETALEGAPRTARGGTTPPLYKEERSNKTRSIRAKSPKTRLRLVDNSKSA